MLPWPSWPLAGQSGLSQNTEVGSTVFLLSGCDWPRYLSGCSRDPISPTPFSFHGCAGCYHAISTRSYSMTRAVALLFLLPLAILADEEPSPEPTNSAKIDLKKMQGTWEIVRIQGDKGPR